MSVEVEIYMSNIIKFFKDNPDELYKLIPQNKKEEFFTKIRKTATDNLEKGDEVTLTKNQIIEICKEMNSNSHLFSRSEGVIVYTPYGEYSLN